MPFVSVEQAIKDIAEGKLIIIVDDENRENEGDLCMAADKVTPGAINFMIKQARGLVCMPVIGQRLDELEIPAMVPTKNTSMHGTAFSVSVDYKIGTTTGISAYDRAATAKAILNPKTKPSDLARPGHLFPLRYQEGGVLVRAGHTEAVVDLTKMAGLYPAGVLCEIIADDGQMARLPELEMFAQQHGINIISIAQIIEHRRTKEKLVKRIAEARLPTEYGDFHAVTYRSEGDPGGHLALTMGQWKHDEPVLVRMHSECLTGDVFKSTRCDCGDQMDMALKAIAHEGKGVFVYLRQEGRGIGLHNKIKAYSLQDEGLDTVDANKALGFAPDLRHYGIGAQILVDLDVKKLKLLTNNPKKVVGMSGWGLEIVERVPIQAPPTSENARYLEAKKSKLGHLIEAPGLQKRDT